MSRLGLVCLSECEVETFQTDDTEHLSRRKLRQRPATTALGCCAKCHNRQSTILNSQTQYYYKFYKFCFHSSCASSILIKACSLPHNLFKVLLLVVSEVIIQFEVIFWRTRLAANTLSVRDISFIRFTYNLSLNAVLHQHVLSTAHGGNYRLWAILKDLTFHANH